jgi:nitrate/TMAO reductase-like tetraheme cytochrome c subunit
MVCLLIQTSLSYAQFSPGELSKAHAHLEGVGNCTQCHVLNKKETTSKCLKCHVEIQQLINQRKGYHSSQEAKAKECASCHGEHFGLDFELTRFDKDKFNHDLSGYTLEGKHAQLACAKCHNKDLIVNEISQKKEHTYLGLGTECLSCHQDFHQSTLSNDCLSCHNQEVFRPTTGFDHAQSNFPLIGKHQEVDCSKCHKTTIKNGKEFQQFTNVVHANCTSCHEDIHNNKFGNDCRKCHDEFSFTQVKGMDNFDHDKTDFPLLGKHQNVDCKSCHQGRLTQAIKHNSCSGCHADYHKNQFAKQGLSPDCAECHTVNGFSPSNYTLERHSRSVFPLEESHRATPCFACHKTDEAWNFSFENTNCTQCHPNFHPDVLPAKYFTSGNCQSCHTQTVWNEITFDHNQTNYKLQGKHQEVVCRSCHFSENENELSQQFTGLQASCDNCHTDVHQKQFLQDGSTDCERCHVLASWQPEKFDHNSARFKLDGEHANLDCVSCHKSTDGLIQDYIIYKFNDISCASCH